jgi:hypothetical protein
MLLVSFTEKYLETELIRDLSELNVIGLNFLEIYCISKNPF